MSNEQPQPNFKDALGKCFGGSKHGRPDYLMNLSCADGKTILDGVKDLEDRIKELEQDNIRLRKGLGEVYEILDGDEE